MDGRRDVCEAVLFDILILLPAVSLLRLKTVCKSWCSIIESSTFITQQLNRNSEMNNLIVRKSDDDEVIMLSGRNYEVCTNLNTEGISPGFLIVSSCNGILCLEYKYSRTHRRLSLWNPATKQVRQLPELLSFSQRDTSLTTHDCPLGFDIKTNDYKIVSISLSHDFSFGFDNITLNDSLVQVYNMRIDSWRTIHKGVDFPIGSINFFCSALCKNGMCLWIGGSSTKNTDVIFYFDLTEEVYGTALLPDDCRNTMYRSLAFVNDKVTYIKRNYGTSPCSYCEVWMMDEFGVKERVLEEII